MYFVCLFRAVLGATGADMDKANQMSSQSLCLGDSAAKQMAATAACWHSWEASNLIKLHSIRLMHRLGGLAASDKWKNSGKQWLFAVENKHI